MCTPRHVRRTIKTLVCLALASFLWYSFGFLDFSARPYDTWEWIACAGSSLFDAQTACTAPRAAIARDVQVVVKTGGSEPKSRLAHQLATSLAGVPQQNILVFSDMEEQVESHRVYDVYADLTVEERAAYPEFALYDAQQEYLLAGKDTRELQGGWDLAKYMNLAMKRKIWSMQRESSTEYLAERKWFVFVDTDTFIEWDNLLELLQHLDPNEQIYIGSPVWLPKLQFAHGGSAYVLSYGAMKALNGPDDNSLDRSTLLYSQYGLNTTALCCGDEALARVLKAKGVGLKGYWPMFNGEKPATVAFGRDSWCEPVISLHHVSGDDMQSLSRWLEEWKMSTMARHPLLFKDLFRYVEPHLSRSLQDWDNMHESMKMLPKDKAAHASLENCRAACEADGLCLQYVYDASTCALSHFVRLGEKRVTEGQGDETRKFTSGWLVDRIRTWALESTCQDAHWVRPNP